MARYNRDPSLGSKLGCNCLTFLIFNVLMGGWSTQYLLNFWVPFLKGHDVAFHAPFWICALLGMIIGPVTFTCAIVTYLIHSMGIV